MPQSIGKNHADSLLTGADGYYSEISLEDPQIRGGFLAFRDFSISRCQEEGQLWTAFPPRSNGKLRPGTPGPLYLVWSKDHPYMGQGTLENFIAGKNVLDLR